jgi:hypothetical protein
VRLHGTAVAAPWDGALKAAMQQRGLAQDEEAMVDVLLQDLAWS